MSTAALILAAGEGKRMKSVKPKVAHEMFGKPLVRWVVDAAVKAGCEDLVCVLGHGREQVEPLVEDTTVVIQEEQLGTGHAVMCAREALAGKTGSLVVLSGDAPLIRPETIRTLVSMREQQQAACVVLTMRPPDPSGYGRIIRNAKGELVSILEHKDCSPRQLENDECNSGIYCFDIEVLFKQLDNLSNENAQGEYYLTDVIRFCKNVDRLVLSYPCDDYTEALGINTRAQLAQVTKIMQMRINTKHMDEGVTMLDPALVWIGPDVKIGRDTSILPMSFIYGETRIGQGSTIGPNSRLTDCVVGRDCNIEETVVIQTKIDNEVTCGPRAYLRPGTHMCDKSKAGTHVEIKKSVIGPGSKVPHLSYIGDAKLGADVNIGAGTITCNYDGEKKWNTSIGDGAFIGSDTMLVAPVTVGEGAVVGAGSTITKDVPARALGIERSVQKNVEGWAERKKK